MGEEVSPLSERLLIGYYFPCSFQTMLLPSAKKIMTTDRPAEVCDLADLEDLKITWVDFWNRGISCKTSQCDFTLSLFL